jgi:hypothetical protein
MTSLFMKKRKWVQEYSCGKFKTKIIYRLSFCNEPITDKKCIECQYRGNEDLGDKDERLCDKKQKVH